ncbi:MAG TPA: hypothetical protein DEO56_01625 [Nitrosomonas nitrosa]|nr:hypothetical protein [Nitrosomonas nitrosa]
MAYVLSKFTKNYCGVDSLHLSSLEVQSLIKYVGWYNARSLLANINMVKFFIINQQLRIDDMPIVFRMNSIESPADKT